MQGFSLAAIILGGILAIWELWPRYYLREAKPDKYYGWIQELEQEGQSESTIHEKLAMLRLEEVRKRIVANAKVNDLKSNLLDASFYCVAVSFAANLLTLAIRLF